MHKIIIVFFLVIFLFGCNSDKESPIAESNGFPKFRVGQEIDFREHIIATDNSKDDLEYSPISVYASKTGMQSTTVVIKDKSNNETEVDVVYYVYPYVIDMEVGKTVQVKGMYLDSEVTADLTINRVFTTSGSLVPHNFKSGKYFMDIENRKWLVVDMSIKNTSNVFFGNAIIDLYKGDNFELRLRSEVVYNGTYTFPMTFPFLYQWDSFYSYWGGVDKLNSERIWWVVEVPEEGKTFEIYFPLLGSQFYGSYTFK